MNWHLKSLHLAWLICVLPGTTGPQVAVAQDPPDAGGLDLMRNGQPSPVDDKVIDTWIRATVDNLTGQTDAPIEADEAVRTLVDAFAAQYNHPENSVAFREKFAERTATLVEAEYARGRELHPLVAKALARVLYNFKSYKTREALFAGLNRPEQVVRYLSAKGLTALQSEIGANTQQIKPTLQLISQAGAKESSGPVVAEIYRACAYTNQAEEAVSAILRTMDGRLETLRQQGAEIGRAELPALEFLGNVTLNGNQKIEVVKRVAPLLRICTMRYAEDGVGERTAAAIEESIYLMETLLAKIVPAEGKTPNISEPMYKGGDTAPIDMQIELLEWVGSKDGPGIFGAAPYSVPAGAP